MSRLDVSIILPCFNEGPTFESNIERIVLELKKLKRTWETILVEDKSQDQTKKLVEKFEERLKNVRAIYHHRNQGRGESVVDGIKAAHGAICGYLDVDLEVSEKYIPIFIKEVESGNDLVVGKRFYESNLNSLTRLLSSKVYAVAVKSILNLPLDDTECGYKFFRKFKVIPILSKVKSKHWFWDTEICAQSYWSKLTISQVPVVFKRRADKKSTVKIIPDSVDYLKNLLRLRTLHNKLND